jgi:hypothetical protein
MDMPGRTVDRQDWDLNPEPCTYKASLWNNFDVWYILFTIISELQSAVSINVAFSCNYQGSHLNMLHSLQQRVSASEVLVPGAMMLILSLIHSQIVSTHTGPTGDPTGGKSRRVKCTKRRLHFSSRSRTGCKWSHFKFLLREQRMTRKKSFRTRMSSSF